MNYEHKHSATAASRTGGAGGQSPPVRLRVHRSTSEEVLLLCRRNQVFLACSVSGDGPEGAIFGMWHWKVGGHVH